MDLRSALSRLVPVPMSTNWTSEATVAEDGRPLGDLPMRSTWWQWRDRVYRHRINGQPVDSTD